MRILYLIDKFPKTSETFISNEINELINLGHDIHVLSKKEKKTKILFFIKQMISDLIKYPIKTIKTINILVNIRREKEFIIENYLKYKIIRNQGFDSIHTPFSFPHHIDNIYFLSKALNIPFSLSFKAIDLYKEIHQQEFKKRRKIIKKSRVILTSSKYNKEHIQKSIINKNIKLIHESIDLNFFKPSNKPKNKNQIISICRFKEKKGLKYLLKALDILNKKNIKYNLTLIGDGPEKQNYEKLIKLLDIPNITFTGTLTSKEIKNYLEKSSIFVLPCIIAKNKDRDILPNVLKEAMAMGLPVITSNICGIQELITNNKSGLLIPPKNPEELAKAIQKLLKNSKLRRKLGKNARKKIQKDFNIKTEVKKLERIFKTK